MKDKNLMISDWVKIKPLRLNTQVAALSEDKNGLYISTRHVPEFLLFKEENFIPIPLTPAILEKNGYKYRDWWYEQEGYPDITNVFTEDMYAVGKHNYYGNGQPEFNSIIKIQYVHELQHALKLCGIEKEIVL